MPTVLEHHADQRPATPQVPREEVRKDPPGCAALGSAAATEHEHLGPTWPTDFAREDALAAVVYVHDADLAGAAATQLEERGVAQCRLMLLERGHIAGEERSPLCLRGRGRLRYARGRLLASEGRRRFTPPAALRRFSVPENGEIGHRRDRFARLHASSTKADAAVISFHVLVGDFSHPNPQLPGCA